MSNPVGDADAVEAMAQTFRREAAKVEDSYQDSVSRLDRTLWIGNRATRTRQRVAGRRRMVLTQADELRSMARDLERHAGWIRQTIRELENLESRCRHWAAMNPPDPTTPNIDASSITEWPEYCSFNWRRLHRFLKTHGAQV